MKCASGRISVVLPAIGLHAPRVTMPSSGPRVDIDRSKRTETISAKRQLMKIDLEGRTAVITGGSRGLGEAMAKTLAGADAQIALVARDRARMEVVRDGIAAHGGVAEVFVADVTQESEVAKLAEAVKARFGSPQILINSAGINLRKNLVDFTLEEFRRVLDASLISTFLMCRAFVPGMRGTGYGRILNMSSIMSHVSLAGRAAYSSAKAALLGLTRALALELASEGITVNGISRGRSERT
jgi:NAD(P)-dependent dehydrogenase (short-subunit alcohol dehydrogenase family)